MEESVLPPETETSWSAAFGQSLDEQQARALELLAAHRRQFDETGRDLSSQLQAAAEAVAVEIEQIERQREEIARREALARDEQENAARQQQLAAERLRLKQDELEQQELELEAARAKLRQAQRVLEDEQDEHAADREQIARRRARLDELQRAAEAEREQLAEQQSETKAQRRRIAQEFRRQRDRQLKDFDARRAELESLEARLRAGQAEQTHQEIARLAAELVERTERLAETARERDVLRERLAASEQSLAELQQQHRAKEERFGKLNAAFQSSQRAVQQRHDELQRVTQQRDEATQAVAALRADRDHLQELQRRLQDELDAQQAQVGMLLEETKQQIADLQAERDHQHARADQLVETLRDRGNESDEELQKLRAEREILLQRVADTEARGGNASAAAAIPNSDLQRRFELAVDDVRSLKRRNAELEEQVTRGGGRLSSGDEGLDWESQKRRLLASLEADAGDELSDDDRLTIEGTVRITDDIVTHKDREIADLKELLSQQSNNIGGVAVGAAAIGAALDSDEIVRQQREYLNEMQTEWRNKLRQAEIDISLERAKLGRQRAEMEEQMRDLEIEKAQLAKQAKAGFSGERGEKPSRNRWLTRLGLRENENG